MGAEGTVEGWPLPKPLQEKIRGGWRRPKASPFTVLPASTYALGGTEIKPQIYTSYAMFFMAVSTVLRKMCKIPNVSVDYAVPRCGNLK